MAFELEMDIEYDSDLYADIGEYSATPGPPGPAGPANTLTIGTVEKGDEAAATITGDSPNQVLNLTLPKGDPGVGIADITSGRYGGEDGSPDYTLLFVHYEDGRVQELPTLEDGASAYWIAVQNGFEGTVEEWLETLKGKNGNGIKEIRVGGYEPEDGSPNWRNVEIVLDDGTSTIVWDIADGASAYWIAVQNGFEGTVEEWLESLKGEPGSGGGFSYEIGHGLKVEDNKLMVDSVDNFDRDNTLPASAALVQTTVGNIEEILKTI